MNPGILAQGPSPVAMPYGLLGRPTPMEMIYSYRYDEDAFRYISGVEQADRQPLEQAVRVAIIQFIVGCKQDGIWSAIKASCILMGARTLSGALTPLVGAAPTNNGPFVSGDYNRKTGLVGNGSTKYLNTNRALNEDPQNDFHMAVYINSAVNNGDYMGDFQAGNGNLLQVFNFSNFSYNRSAAPGNRSGVAGFFGNTRSASNAFTSRGLSGDASSSLNSVAPPSRASFVLARNGPTGPTSYSASRLAFYSLGQSLVLSALDSRVTTLYNAIAAAIP